MIVVFRSSIKRIRRVHGAIRHESHRTNSFSWIWNRLRAFSCFGGCDVVTWFGGWIPIAKFHANFCFLTKSEATFPENRKNAHPCWTRSVVQLLKNLSYFKTVQLFKGGSAESFRWLRSRDAIPISYDH